ncbi:MAG: CARDB domain-containing protein [Poseidonia sp.]
MVNHQRWTTVLVTLVMVAVSWSPLLVPEDTFLAQETTTAPQHTEEYVDQFATSNGFSHTNLTQSASSGLTELKRPPVSWTATSGIGLTQMRTGACSAYLPATEEVFLIGGRIDVDPSQTGDEANTKTVEIFDVVNKTWTPAVEQLQETQQYHKCTVVGDTIYAIGDHHPYSSPATQATGLVQVYDATDGNWSYGTSMPGNQSVGLAGVASLNGLVYVAGGVSAKDRSDSTDRLLRYDPVNDSWTQMANMNNQRHSFELVAFRGKLIAYGGVAVFFDPIANTTVEKETNLTEAYDPITDSWTQLPNATHKFSAYAAAVFNDEIIIHGGYETSGWSGSSNDKTYGYDPFINHWNTYATLPIGLYDSTLALANDTLVYASGDTSYTRFSTWSIQYLAENEYHVNPTSHHGLLTSSIYDLRPSTEGAASLLWLRFSAIEPSGTDLGLQYRTADTMQNMASAAWLPTTVPVSTYLEPGNQSLVNVPEDASFLQYRVKYATTRLMEWVTPTLVNVSIGADSAAFETSPPSTMQPTSAPVNILTQHHATTQDGTYVLALHPTDASGSFDPGSDWLTLTWDTATATLTVDDPSTLLFNQQASATLGPMTDQGQTVNWTFSLGGTMPTDYLKFMTSTHAERNASYLHGDITSIDRSVSVVLQNVTADVSSQGDDTVEAGEVLPGNTALNLTIDHRFTNSGLRLLGGTIQCRIHMDLHTFDEDAFGERIWSNQSSAWFDLPAGQVEHALVNAPESLSGELRLWIEARTSEDWDLVVDSTPFEFVLNGEGPTLLDVSPDLDAYTNEEVYRTVSFQFHDVGGFTNETLAAYSWLEARDDGANGGLADGVPQRVEYQPSLFYTHQNGNLWTVNITVNDTVNGDHQWGRVLLEGTDLAGFSVPATTAEEGHARWESRTPTKGELVAFEPTTNLLSDTMMRFEPAQTVGWRVAVTDANGLSDLTELRLEVGNDDRLGVKYTTADDTCASLDERLLLLPSGCEVTQEAGILTVAFTATVQWSLTMSGLAAGELDVIIRDYDGTHRESFTEAWVLEREMAIDVNQLRDTTGEVQQNIVAGAVLMGGDGINLTASVSHRTSATPYSGDLRLRWDGLLQGEPWRGGETVTLVDGVLSTSIPTPEASGLVQDMTLMLWDPLETELLSVYEMPVFQLDFDAPELLPSAITDTISRYKLEEVEIGVNIAEDQAWSSDLKLTCQIRSIAQSWEPVSLVRNSTTVFDGKTMFSFMFDFSGLGDPSQLSQQANLNCWAEGADDAGWDLASSTGNSELDPWLEAPLNNIGPDLALENVELTGELEAGENVRLSFFVVNGGEQLPTPFNATIELVQGDERTMVGRSVFYSMDANTAKSVKRSFTAPEGDWTLEITVDKEGLVWEIDETNNVWSTSVAGSSGGFGAVAMTLGGVGLLALLGAGVVLRRRTPAGIEENVAAALEATGQVAATPASTDSGNTPPATPATATAQPPKKRGPPGGKVASSPVKTPGRGPPRGPPKAVEPTAATPAPTPQEMAAQHMAALGVPAQAVEGEERVADYSQLPGGGEYEYTAEGTFYVGATCGRWRLNDDKSFTKLSDEP